MELGSKRDASTDPASLVGSVLDGDYRIVGMLGAGGMGQLYEARHVRLPRSFAIKVIRADLATDPGLLDRFRREAEVTSALGNRHIVDVLDFNVLPDGSPYMVMELLRGEDLAARLRRCGRLSQGQVGVLLSQLNIGLGAAHAQGVLHRDIKPENIFLVADGNGDFVKLLDFGLSKVLGGKRLTQLNAVMGTPAYMSPEQARGDDALDHRSDIYAVGVVLYQALTGRLPFEGENPLQLMARIVREPPTPPSHYAPELPPALTALLMQTLEKDPAQRPATMADLWQSYRAAVGEVAVGAPELAPHPADHTAMAAHSPVASRPVPPIPLDHPVTTGLPRTAISARVAAVPSSGAIEPTAMAAHSPVASPAVVSSPRIPPVPRDLPRTAISVEVAAAAPAPPVEPTPERRVHAPPVAPSMRPVVAQGAAVDSGSSAQAPVRGRRLRPGVIALGILAIVALVAIAFLLMRPAPPPPAAVEHPATATPPAPVGNGDAPGTAPATARPAEKKPGRKPHRPATGSRTKEQVDVDDDVYQ